MVDSDTPEDMESFWQKQEHDYYAILGVDRSASPEEIRSRFMVLSRAFHPDRIRNRQANLLALANTQYPLLDRAYKVLSDPLRRLAYDHYGEKGVEAVDQDARLSNALAVPYKSSEDVRKQIEAILRRLNEEALEAQFSSFSEMAYHVDMSDFVASPMMGLKSLFQPHRRYAECTEITIHQRTTIPLNTTTKLTLGGYLYDKKGIGFGALTAQLQHYSSDPGSPSAVCNLELGWTPKINCQITQHVSPYTAFILLPQLDDHGLDVTIGANRALSTQVQGGMFYSTRSGMQTNLNWITQSDQITSGISIHPRGAASISADYNHQFTADTSAKIAMTAGMLEGASLKVSASSQVTSKSRASWGVVLQRQGISVRIGLARGSVRFVVPIFLSPFAPQRAWNTFLAATVPFLASAFMAQVWRPSRAKRASEQKQEETMMRQEFLRLARQNALAQQRLMLRWAYEKMEKERAVASQGGASGLVILVARYGKNPSSPSGYVIGNPVELARVRSGGASGVPRSTAGPFTGNVNSSRPPPSSSTTAPPPSSGIPAIPVSARFRSSIPILASSEEESPPTGFHDFLVDSAIPILEEPPVSQEAVWDENVDVTIPLQFFVQDSHLELSARSKAGLLGFYNPCVGEYDANNPLDKSGNRPQLYIRYSFGDTVYEATFDDDQEVDLPSRFAQPMGKVDQVEFRVPQAKTWCLFTTTVVHALLEFILLV